MSVSLDGKATRRQIRGSYRGSPGCVADGLREAKVNNPVFVIEGIVLLLVGELLAALLLGEKEVADVRALVAHRRALEGPLEHPRQRDAATP